MKKSIFESLPNELLLIIFNYLSSFDLFQAFFDLKNARIEHLLPSVCYSLDVSTMHYDTLRKFLINTDNNTAKHFTALIDTVILDDSIACTMLLEHWCKTLNNTEPHNILLPSIERIVMLNVDYQYNFIESLLTCIVSRSNRLQYLHLMFERPLFNYPFVLSQLVSNGISIHTMILEVEKGHQFYPRRPIDDLYKMNRLYWPSTNRLTLSIQHSSELILLLQRDALPMLEHLNVTNEQVLTDLSLRQDKSILNPRYCAHGLYQTVDGTRLRSLLLRYLTLGDFIILMDMLNMPLLEKLILVDLYDHTLDHIGKFQEFCGRNCLPSLKHLHFSFCFPTELEYAWRNSSFGCNNEWPFDNIDCYTDENCILTQSRLKHITENFFVVYKRPVSVLLKHKRTLHNHLFTTHASTPLPIISRRRSIEWTLDRIYEPDQLLNNLKVISTSCINKLCLTYVDKPISVSTISDHISNDRLLFNNLRSMTFDLEHKSLKGSYCATIVQQILNASPNLSHVVVAWNDFRKCSQTYSNLKHVHLILYPLYPEPKQHFNVRRLTQLVPNLYRLETSGAHIWFNEKLVKFIFKIIRHFHQLVYLTINKDGLYPFKEQKKMMFKESLIAAGHNRLFDSNNIQIKFPRYSELKIWL